ncbi:hypothetical protein RintRC_1179 [Richelia intracellularis]|nr:hypothetical protein RintRC_1179 [Richelia intracellularis]
MKLDGNPWRKSAKVLNNLQELNLLGKIDEIIAAVQRQASSEGFNLANKYQVESAPFCFVNHDEGLTRVYTAYHPFIKNLCHISFSEAE